MLFIYIRNNRFKEKVSVLSFKYVIFEVIDGFDEDFKIDLDVNVGFWEREKRYWLEIKEFLVYI